MVFLRATQKVLRYLPPVSSSDLSPDTALGDWYVKRMIVDRVPLLVLISSASLLPLVIRARDLRSLPERLPDLVGARLRRLGVPLELVEAELVAMSPVEVAKTVDRSVLGVLVDFGKLLYHILPEVWNEGDFRQMEWRLAETPCFAGRGFDQVVVPKTKAPELLFARWGAG